MAIRRVERIDRMVPVRNAFMSVFDKSGLSAFVNGLIEECPEIMIYSTGGTFKQLVETLGDKAEQYVQEVSKYTGMQETEGGLVKSLHHKLFLGYLTETYCYGHQNDLKRENAVPIDLFVGNLYPFNDAIAKEGADIEDARGNIDVGGPSATRAAAKNWHRVLTVVDPNDYESVLEELMACKGCTTAETRFHLQKKAWAMLARYDGAIAEYNANVSFKEAMNAYTIVGIDSKGGE